MIVQVPNVIVTLMTYYGITNKTTYVDRVPGRGNGADGVKKNVVRRLLENLKKVDCVADLDVDGEHIRIDLKSRGW